MKPIKNRQLQPLLPTEITQGRPWVFWSGIGLFLSLIYFINDWLSGFHLSFFLLVWGFGSAYLWALSWPFIARCARRLPPVNLRNITVHLVLSILLGVLGSLFFTWLLFLMRSVINGHPFNFQRAFASMVNYFFFAMIIFYWAVVAADRAFYYLSAYRREELRRAEMARVLSEAQLEVLRSQLQPHFLFNTFHGIAALMRTGRSQLALDTLLQLGSLLRFTLDAGRRGLIPLAEELAFLKDFMAIEQRRFSDRLNFTLTVDEEAKAVLVPAMILQPLAENAIHHGLEADPDAGNITLEIWVASDRLHMVLEDDGPGLKEGYREGIGLGTTRRRLEQRYGNGSTFCIGKGSGKGVKVRLSLPLAFENHGHQGDAEPAPGQSGK